MAATIKNCAGKDKLPWAREIVTVFSSKGCLRFSRTSRENSGNSSRKRTPLWAREISPGLGQAPPPTRATPEAVWCGDRKGLCDRNDRSFFKSPATLQILVTSIASSRFNFGRIDASAFASRVLPEPGGPEKITL